MFDIDEQGLDDLDRNESLALTIPTGQVIEPHALTDMSWQEVVKVLTEKDLSLCLTPEDLNLVRDNLTWRQGQQVTKTILKHYTAFTGDVDSISRLLFLVSRFRKEVLADLRETFHVDLSELFSTRRWKDLLDLIDSLPGASRLTAALLLDKELAEQILKDEEEKTEKEDEWSPNLSEYTLTNHLMIQLIDHIASLEATLIAVNGGKPQAPRPVARPKTAVEELREARSREMQHSIIALFAPKHSNSSV